MEESSDLRSALEKNLFYVISAKQSSSIQGWIMRETFNLETS